MRRGSEIDSPLLGDLIKKIKETPAIAEAEILTFQQPSANTTPKKDVKYPTPMNKGISPDLLQERRASNIWSFTNNLSY